MIGKNFYTQITFRVLFMVATIFFAAYFFNKAEYLFLAILLTIVVVQTVSLIKYIDSTNRKIAYFFNAIKNEDFTLKFPDQKNVTSFKELNKSINRLNALVQEVHIKKQEQEQYYLEILKQAQIGVLTHNKKGHIMFVNPRVEQLLNYTPLNHIKQLKKVDNELYELFDEMKPFERKLFQLTNERETVQLAIKSTEINLNKEVLRLITVQDIKSELEEKETDSWIKLIRVLTHEIMNTVAPITSISESILSYYKEGEDATTIENFDQTKLNNTAKGLQVIKDQGNDLMNFVQSYRSFLSVPKPDKKIILVKDLLERIKMLAIQEVGFDNDACTITNHHPELELFADEKQLSQVLLNLCKNAIQSMLATENAQLHIESGMSSEGYKFIAIKDNGPGIPQDVLDQIFIPFFTTKEQGTGIGLSLSKQIMQLHGGSLNVYSIPNKETVFRLVF
ncbi:sensor histidine kinase [Spongiivirga citrea]|uniref:histidine kinase n=1 Tax=Spongiivirga citrea TaxID=1481457 RepID=A0A6M0CIK0_9FLAO|nr:ATP-binding protein [Spongiivirga citrea]NER17352.1 histidine kinase [Spongiivirga citrea]